MTLFLLKKLTKENISGLEGKIHLNIPSSSDWLFVLSGYSRKWNK